MAKQFYFFLIMIFNCSIEGINVQEENLMNMLFGSESQYNPLITPIQNTSELLDIYFGLTLAQIINVYEKEQIVKVNVWLQLRWFDYQMKWNPDRFGRLESIRVPPDKIWTPDLVLFNNADGNYEVSYKSNVVIYSEGGVLWIPPAIFKLTCTINVEFFPFDKQRCELRFGSSGRSAAQIRFGWYATMNSMELSDYVPSSSWTLVDAPAEIRTVQSTEPPYEFRNEMVFFMIMRRKPLFYTINLIVPTMMISVLSITLFFLPSEAGEKMMLCTSILISLVFVMLLISRILPSTSLAIPLISKYLMFTFMMNLLTVFLSALSLHLHHRRVYTLHPVPHWMQLIFFHALPSFLCLSTPYDNFQKKSERSSSIDRRFIARNSRTRSSKPTSNFEFFTDKSAMIPIEMTYLIRHFIHSSNDIRYLSQKIEGDTEEIQIRNDWKFISLVIDRIQLFVFLLVTLIGTLAIIFQDPKVFEPHRDAMASAPSPTPHP